MKLRTLKVHGFKSFADSTTVDFHDGITAVVGPNGCGKSNISDAIRWVLGEQRPTAIRGAKMEEAIFQGTVHRRPVNRGSVSLVVSNEDRTLPLPFEEVEVGRQVFRDGGSEYSINRSACRLRDVVDLCRDTGLGANAYSIIENRMIDAILSDRAEERRGLFEEAAGIGKYKDRRKAATRRLERAEMDLQRLEDVIGEVQTKVRSLARQKGKAQRYTEYRQRRLDVEVAVVRHRLDQLRQALTGIEEELSTGVGQSDGTASELASAEAAYESLRLEQIEAEGGRAEAAQALEEVRTELARWERDLAVADERAAYAERRLAQIEAERTDAQEQSAALAEDEKTLSAERETVGSELESVRGAAAERAEVVSAVRARLEEAREQLETVEGRARELARRGAQLQGDADASDAQGQELDARMARVRGELDSAAQEIADLESQGDLFSGRVSDLADGVDAARQAAVQADESARESRAALDRARVAEGEATRTLAAVSARRVALETLERDGSGVQPVVKAVVEAGLTGVRGVLTDFVSGDAAAVAAAEAYLGPLANALVVDDTTAVDRVLAWFTDSWDGGGGLVLLALDRAPAAASGGDLLGRLDVSGEGAEWVRALLGAVEIGTTSSDAVAVTTTGGVVRVGNPGGGSGVLQRREELKALTAEEAGATQALESASSALAAAEKAATDADAAHEAARRALQEAEDEHRRLDAEMSAQTDRRSRADSVRDELARQLEGAKAARTRATERAAEARADRETVLEQEAGLQAERDEARAAADAVQEEWETARAAEARVAVDVARLEGDFRRLTDRFDGIQASRKRATERVAALDAEEASLVEERAGAKAVREEGDAATERLFESRTASEALLRERDAAMQRIAEAVQEAERRARDARSAERAATDRRHQLELKKQECVSSIDRIRDRLEGEWGRPLDALLEEASPVEGEPEALQQELEELIAAIERLGPVNMLAVEEHAEESERLEFLTSQRADLVEARNDLRSAIREINKTATELFAGTFEQIRENFRETFLRLFEGGEADIWLQDKEDPLESPIEIHASPRGKKTQRIDLLSGGERALTALSLLFGIYLVKPSPFCVLDEVDAPLDENNIGRFIRLLQDFKDQTQFVVITHNPRTIEAADWIYGVTMEEPGVSQIVGVRLEEALHAAGAA